MPKFDPTQCKTQLKLAMSRIKLQKNKKDNLVKTGKREVADFLRTGKEGDARVRVENVIKDDFTIETLELMELFCELLMSRLTSIQTSKECPGDLKEAICTIIYAAPRLDIEELSHLREIFAHKYGKPFAMDAMSNKEGCVNARVVHKLSILTPENYLVYQYMTEIAKSFGVDWKAPQQETVSAPVVSKQSQSPAQLSFPSPPTHTASQPAPQSQTIPTIPDVPVPVFNVNDLPGGGGLNFPSTPSFPSTPGNPPSNFGGGGGLSFPSPPSNTPSNSGGGSGDLNFPSPPSNTPSKSSGGGGDLNFPSPPSNDKSSNSSGIPDFDELNARFERLKKKDQ